MESSNAPRAGRSVMAGGGLYNEHSQPQHVAGGDGVPLLVRACEAVPLDDERGLVVADYGSSQGRNSLVPMGAAVETLRGRLGADSPISIFHTDLPGNDFAALFTTLETDPHSYLRGAMNVFGYAAGGSFYERLFPAEHVAVGWSSIAVHWLSSVPAPLREHIFSPLGDAQERAAYAARAAEDWQLFLRHRLEELEQDGQLVVVGSGAGENGRSGAEGLLEIANDVLREMVAENTLSRQEYEQMVVPTYYRTLDEFTEPLGKPTPAGSFELLEHSQTDLADPPWAGYERSGDVSAYAKGVAEFLRAFSEPSLFAGIAAGQSPQATAKLADEFYGRVAEAVAKQPAQARCNWRLVLLRLAKRR
jgi:hypothetical protein